MDSTQNTTHPPLRCEYRPRFIPQTCGGTALLDRRCDECGHLCRHCIKRPCRWTGGAHNLVLIAPPVVLEKPQTIQRQHVAPAIRPRTISAGEFEKTFYEEIAQALGISQWYAKTLCNRTMRKLRNDINLNGRELQALVAMRRRLIDQEQQKTGRVA